MLWRPMGAVMVVAVGLPAMLSTCPDSAILNADCGGARGSSIGNCLVCMSSKHGTACVDAEVDAFCSGDSGSTATCDSATCRNGGKCKTAGGGNRILQTCSAANLSSSTAAVNNQCCGADDAACAKGMPTSCDAGCAAVFLPFWDSCGWELGSAGDYANVVSLCEALVHGAENGVCDCSDGYTGAHCEQPPAALAHVGFEKVTSHIAGITAAGLKFIEDALPTASQGSSWALCYDSRTDCTACPSATVNDRYGFCSCPSGSTNTFHGGCDAHNETLVLASNSLGFTFGGFAQESWGGGGPYVSEATENFLFRLVKPNAGPVVYRSTGHNKHFQYRDPGFWPTWGDGYDLCFGDYGVLGHGFHTYCLQGQTYVGEPNDVCGAGVHADWGATEMEVWYRVVSS